MMTFRALMHQIRPQDKLCFLHVPATGGTGIRNVLKQYCETEEMTSFKSQSTSGFASYKKEIIPDDAGLLLGYYDWSIYRDLDRVPIYITFLREPVDRVLSLYELGRQYENHFLFNEINTNNVSLEDFITKEKYHHLISNSQCIMLASPVQNQELPDSVLLEMAKINLEETAFFGLTERYMESLQLLADTFFWDPLPYSGWFRSQYDLGSVDDLPDKIIKRIPQTVQKDKEYLNYLKYCYVLLTDKKFEKLMSNIELWSDVVCNSFSCDHNTEIDFLKLNTKRKNNDVTPQSITEKIRELNQLDSQLYEFAEKGFQQRLEWMEMEKNYYKYPELFTLHDKK